LDASIVEKYRNKVSQKTKLVRQKISQSILIVQILPSAHEKTVCGRQVLVSLAVLFGPHDDANVISKSV